MRECTEPRPLAVRCRGLVRHFGSGETRSSALAGVDLDVPAGELMLLVGPSGCGKTTLISVIAGILKPDKGEVEVLGTRLDELPGRKAARFRSANVGFVTQQFNLLPSLTALENAAVPLLVKCVPQRQAEARAAALLEELDLGAHAMKYPGELSMGQQQRVAIARALVHEPRLIVCDEPTAALDAATGYAAMRLIRRAALDPDRAVIVVTHDPRALPFADSIAHMSDGAIAGVVANAAREAA